MLLVLILLGIFILLSIIILILLLSNIQIELKNVIIENIQNKNDKNYEIILSLYFLGKIKILKMKLSKNKMKQKIKEKINLLKLKNKAKQRISKIFKKNEILKIIKILSAKIKKLDLKIYLGLEDAVETSLVTAGIASTIGIIYPHIIEKEDLSKCSYFVNPLYEGENLYYVSIDLVISLKILHILQVAKYLTK